MNDRLRLPIILTILVCAVAPAVARAETAEPSPDVAPRCPVCVVAAPELIDLAGAAFVGVTAGEAIDRAAQEVERTEAVHTGVRIAHHPHAFRSWIRWAKGNATSGRNVWRAFHGKVKAIYRWLRGGYTLRKLKRKLPRAAVACVVSGTVVGIHTRSADKAAWSCLGAALGALSSAKARAEAGGE
jgi:hypothetical protein